MTRPLVLVADPIADEGLSILREHARVECGPGSIDPAGRSRRVIVRSDTRVTADLLDRAPRLRVIGRAGPVWTHRRRNRDGGCIVVVMRRRNRIAAASTARVDVRAGASLWLPADAALKRGDGRAARYIGTELSARRSV